jgi:hypothetical protein
MKSFKLAAFIFIAILALAGSVIAQTPPEPFALQAGGAGAVGPVRGPMLGMHVEDNMDVAPVKGSPFCANVNTDHTQSFADGNRIHTTETSVVCRDSEGRTRRESSLNLLGAGPQATAPKLITILDPIAGVRYLLDSEHKIAHKTPLPQPGTQTAAHLGSKGEQIFIMRAGPPDAPGAVTTNMFYRKTGQDSNEPAPATENLGDQSIDGIAATGTRITTTIPAGKMGNEKPIVVTSERWYSSDLKATIMTKHDDPWAGELKTQFTNINSSEPDPSLFTVPGDYKILDDKEGPVMIRMQAPAPPPPPQ